MSKSTGEYVSPHAGKALFGDHARKWLQSWNTERTTAARDASIMRTHVLPQWESRQLRKIDHLSVQHWLSDLSKRRSRATVAESKRIMSAVMRSAVKNRLIGIDPTVGVRVPGRRIRDTDERVIERDDVRFQLAAAVRPVRYRTFVLTAAFTGMRSGEVAGLCADALDLDKGVAHVVRTVTEAPGTSSSSRFRNRALAGGQCRCRNGWWRSCGNTSRRIRLTVRGD